MTIRTRSNDGTPSTDWVGQSGSAHDPRASRWWNRLALVRIGGIAGMLSPLPLLAAGLITATAGQNLFRYNAESSELEPISKSEQFAPFEDVHTHRRCPGGATQPAPDGSNPWVGGDSVDSSECNPADVPPGP